MQDSLRMLRHGTVECGQYPELYHYLETVAESSNGLPFFNELYNILADR